MPTDADKRTYVIFRFWLCSHESSLPAKEKIISRAFAHPVGLLRKLHCEPAAWIVHSAAELQPNHPYSQSEVIHNPGLLTLESQINCFPPQLDE
jgi:hypothetical protein